MWKLNVRYRAALLFVFVALLAGCGGGPAGPTPTPTLSPDSAEGRGYVLFAGKGRCATCHSRAPNTVIVGPSLAGIASRAGSREPGVSAVDYLQESILQPDKFKVPGYEKLQMDTSLAKTLTGDEIGDLVAYLMTLK